MRSGTHACTDRYFAHTVLIAVSLPYFDIIFQFFSILQPRYLTCSPDPHFYESGNNHRMSKARETILSALTAQIQQFAFQKIGKQRSSMKRFSHLSAGILIAGVPIIIEYSR
jgi:hypothetical protein